ncbi:LysE family translocator [Methylophaga sp. UBA2689]|jgi:threonine/homoserine/homoserine lactone efflux protein|uniref:LysE family translocator n=1 Tax=Methylophaga sp. UBA2689 TaxID=1946878 RepID=UPI0025F08931|nr:LysE family translocator [Methylophaga sp. UBA2689]|tara:strand:- start:258 stop:881 length:624 start_codon:yes stop_codon:yes gene_type:complete
MPIEVYAVFIFTSALLALAPGPDNIFVLTQSALYGKRSGILITLGLCTGLVFHTCLVAFGVATIIQTSDWALSALKVIGALYLVYLAWQMLNSQTEDLSGKDVVLSDTNLYLRGIVMNVTNPKVSIFFLAFLPQFASSNYGAITPQIILLGTIFGAVSLFIFSGISILASKLGDLLKRKPNAQVYLSRMTALIFVVLAFNLLMGLIS